MRTPTALLALALASPALAQDITVDPNATPGPYTYSTLQAGLNAATNGANVFVYPGDYTAETGLSIGRNLQLIGTDQATVLLPPLDTAVGVFGNPTVRVENATLFCPPGLIENALYKAPNVTLELVDVLSNCGDNVDRIVVRAEGAAPLSITTSTFLGSGTHVLSDGSPVDIVDSDFSGLLENSRGLLYRDNLGAAVAPDLSISGSTFNAYEEVGFNGGAIYVNAPTNSFTVLDTVFRDNLAATGSGMYIRDGANVLLERVEFENDINGALTLVDSTAVIRDAVFLNNPEDAIRTSGIGADTLTIEGTRFRDNGGLGLSASYSGGITVQTSHFCNNAGDIQWTDGDLTVEGVTFALGNGVVDAINGGPSVTGILSLTNVTIAGYEGAGVSVGAATAYTVQADETLFHDLAGDAVYGDGTPTLGAGFYNNLYAVTGMWGGGQFLPGDFDNYGTTLDPMFQGYVDRLTTTCDTLNLWLDPASPVRDLGQGTDLDGSASDIGAYGGLLADLVDADGDNAYEDIDCDETDSSIYPGATDVAHDGIDQDCDGADNLDADGDGVDADFAGGTDCNDNDATVYPGALETPWDGIDQDCDGYDLVDVDGDGVDGANAGGDDCDDLDPTVYPGATEVWYDGVDQDCDGASDYDQDGDGYDSAADSNTGDDCDDLDETIHPGASELPDDGIDQDCDGVDDTTGTGTGTGTGTATGTGTGTGGNGGGDDEPKDTGCSHTGSAPAPWLALVAPLLLAFRRRS